MDDLTPHNVGGPIHPLAAKATILFIIGLIISIVVVIIAWQQITGTSNEPTSVIPYLAMGWSGRKPMKKSDVVIAIIVGVFAIILGLFWPM